MKLPNNLLMIHVLNDHSLLFSRITTEDREKAMDIVSLTKNFLINCRYFYLEV